MPLNAFQLSEAINKRTIRGKVSVMPFLGRLMCPYIVFRFIYYIWPRDHISHYRAGSKGNDPNLPGWQLGLRPKPAGLFPPRPAARVVTRTCQPVPSGLAARVATRTCRPVPIRANGWGCDPNLPACFCLGWQLGLRTRPASLFPSGLAVRVATRTCRPVSVWADS